MRTLFIVLLLMAISGCCTSPPPIEVQACPCEESAPVVKTDPEPVPMPATIDEAVTEGFVICRRDGDVRIIGIQELGDGKCMLLYDNRLNGNGTQNMLPNKAACELQQLRMKQNFVRAGFRCR
jgi:hypothetical protein